MKKFQRNLAVLGVTLLLVSCRSLRLTEPERELPGGDVPVSLTVTGTAVPMPERWWEAFGSRELDGFMERAFNSNLGLAQAWAQLRQARASARAIAADGRLQLTGNGETGRTDSHGDTHTSTRSYSAGLSVSYEVDLWGQITSAVDAARLETDASEQDVKATALTLTREIASAWLSAKSYQAQLTLVESQIRTANEYLDLLKLRQRKGASELVDVLQQRQDVASLESTAEGLRESLAAARLQLAYLLGLPDDSTLELGEEALPPLPPLPDPGVPADLLARRPDVAAARLRLRAQEKTVAAARAARLPSLSLTGSVGDEANHLKDLFDSWASNLAAGLTAPLLDGGRLAAGEESAKALLDERFLSYRDTVLSALIEVNEALVRERSKQAYLERVQTEAVYAEETFTETRQRYFNGKNDYLSVLNALTTKQTIARTLVTAEAALLANRVDLCAALGGSWLDNLKEPK